jgi:hypothetical protein
VPGLDEDADHAPLFECGTAGHHSTNVTISRSISTAKIQESMTNDEWNQYMREFLKRRLSTAKQQATS